MRGLLIAQVEHKPPVDHAVILVAIILIALLAAVVYGLVRVMGRSRARRTRSDRGPANDPGSGP
jgi:hypothetical protein